jgi:hypothetical protein
MEDYSRYGTIEQLLGNEREKQSSSLALFRLLFGKERFTQFQQLITNICVNEHIFEQVAIPLDNASTRTCEKPLIRACHGQKKQREDLLDDAEDT